MKNRSALAAALLAIALLSLAFVRSTVMQAEAAIPSAEQATCGGMATVMALRDGHGAPAGPAHKACPYCAAAARPVLRGRPRRSRLECSGVDDLRPACRGGRTRTACLRPEGAGAA